MSIQFFPNLQNPSLSKRLLSEVTYIKSLSHFQEIGRAGNPDHHCVMTHKLHADAGNEKFIALLAMNEETQMETLSYDDAVVAPKRSIAISINF